MDLHDLIPALIHISDGKLHDVNVLDIMPVEAGAFYVMDRGYLDFKRLYATHQAAAFFVARAKAGMDAQRAYSAPLDRSSGVICDQRIMLNSFYSAKHDPEHLRACSKCSSIIKKRSICHPECPRSGWRDPLLCHEQLQADPSSGFALVRDDILFFQPKILNRFSGASASKIPKRTRHWCS